MNKSSNFASFAPPPRKRVRVDVVEPSNRAELHCLLIEPDIPTGSRVIALGAAMTRKYVPLEYRKDPENTEAPVDFPATATSGVITLTEDSCMGYAALFVAQSDADGDDLLSFESWVYCSLTCPAGFAKAIAEINKFGSVDSGNAKADGDSESSAPPSTNPSLHIHTS